MSKTNKRGKSKAKGASSAPNEKSVAENRKAWHKYEVIESLECGLVLVGSEVKSLREGKLSLAESYARVKAGEVWLIGADIPVYPQANWMNHEPKRPRKLLLHQDQIRKFANKAHENGLTLVPLKVYFKRGRAKMLLGLCRGKKMHDKRESMKKADSQRQIQRAMRHRRR